ncbi:MAG TPA: histidine kinase [Streptosporangiaceae bacterium]|nr:histidine kinase [Streptosporangiaceae bacterium]
MEIPRSTDPTAGGSGGSSPRASTDVTRVIDVIRAAGIATGIVVVSVVWWRPWTEGTRGVVLAILLAASAIGWIGWLLTRRLPVPRLAALIVMAGAGGVLTGMSPRSAAVGIGCLVAFSAGDQLQAQISAWITAETVMAFLIAGLVTDAPPGFLIGYPFAFIAIWLLGLTRRSYRVRTEHAEQLLTQTRRVHEAETHAAAAAERARIAREIHDVLAHSLAAVSVNLQAAEGLLETSGLPAEDPDLAKAIACLSRAGTMTREGLAAARQAVLALRDDDAAPLPDQLEALAEQYRAVGDLALDYTVTGQARKLPVETSLTAFRTAQEALTNARKHAPGQPVSLWLCFEPDQITISVTNPLPPPAAPSQLAGAGAGYGLAGLRERAALAGGELQAGRDGSNWQVGLRVPA